MKVGYITGFTVLKALPGYDTYLCKLSNSPTLALLPKKWARKEYRVGETDWASIDKIEGPRVTLSQKSPQYIRKILEYLLLPALEEKQLRVKRIARASGFRYCKVAIESLNGEITDSTELYSVLKPYLEKVNLRDYFFEKLSFVAYSSDLTKFVVNALCPPGSRDKIWKVTHHKELRKVVILVDSTCVGLFKGKGGENCLVACKLCSVEVEVRGISTAVYDEFASTWRAEPVAKRVSQIGSSQIGGSQIDEKTWNPDEGPLVEVTANRGRASGW